METRWEFLTPPEFDRMAKEEQVCLFPMGSLERHGDHMPFGTDGLIAHEMCYRASQKEPCVVFPTYWFGQVHEAACFSGTVNLHGKLMYEMFENTLDQIGRNGFKKIIIVTGHGGNMHFLRYFAMSQLDREVPYTLYIVDPYGDNYKRMTEGLWETACNHAAEDECSRSMAVSPEGTVKMEQQTLPEPILPKVDISHLPMTHTGLWWYAAYPENVTESPSHATREKGDISIEANALDLAEEIARIKADEVIPGLQQEFYARCRKVGKF